MRPFAHGDGGVQAGSVHQIDRLVIHVNPHGGDALALYPKYKDKIKAVLMDMMMPVMDGSMAIAALKKEQPNLPIIAISGLAQTDKVSQRLAALGIPFLPKPFEAEKLLRCVRKVLGREVSCASEHSRARSHSSTIGNVF